MVRKSKKIGWYSEGSGFFGPEYLQEYEGSVNSLQTEKETEFISRVLHLPIGSKILDIPCGHGRHSVALACRGYDITGQDINPFFIKEAAKKAKSVGVDLSLICADMRKIPFVGVFDASINMFSSFGYLESDKEDLKVLLQINRALKIGATFILDVINREIVIGKYQEREVLSLLDGSSLVIERRFDLFTGRNIEKRTRIEAATGKELRKTFLCMRMYSLPELIAMLKAAGFKVMSVFGGYDFEDISLVSDRCILVAKKQYK